MSSLLSQVGEDLAVFVKANGLPTVPLEVMDPTLKGTHLFDYVLLRLRRQLYNSLFLVADSLNYVRAYANSLALVMEDEESFTDVLFESCRRVHTKYGRVDQETRVYLDRLVGKRLHTLHLEKLLNLTGDDFSIWKQVIPQLFREARHSNYFFVIYDLDLLFDVGNDENLVHQGYSFFLASRGRPNLTFIAPLDWWQFSNGIERGLTPNIVMHVSPILFSPRPPDVPPYYIESWKPERFYDF